MISIVKSEAELLQLLPDLAVGVNDISQVCDIYWAGSEVEIYAERKKFPSNLLQDIPTGHLAHQLIDTATGHPDALCLLILEELPHITPDGHLEDWRWTEKGLSRMVTGWKWQDVLMYLISSYALLGVLPVWTESLEGTANLIRKLHAWSFNKKRGSWMRRKPKISNLLVDTRVATLSSIPRIGETTAIALLQSKGTLAKVFSSPVQELAAMPRVGHKKAEELYYWANLLWDN